MRLFFAIVMGLMLAGIYCFMTLFFGTPSPQAGLTFMSIMFVIGVIAGWYDYGRRQRRKEEEAERQAEQDRTNELMREYLEKKLREEENNK